MQQTLLADGTMTDKVAGNRWMEAARPLIFLTFTIGKASVLCQ